MPIANVRKLKEEDHLTISSLISFAWERLSTRVRGGCAPFETGGTHAPNKSKLACCESMVKGFGVTVMPDNSYHRKDAVNYLPVDKVLL